MSSKSFQSPRSSKTVGSSPRRVSGQAKSFTADQVLWAYSAAAVVVTVVVYLMARDKYSDVHSWARVPIWASNPVLVTLLLIVSLLMAASATAAGARGLDQKWSVIVQGLFLSIAVLLLVVVYLVYRVHNFLGAFYLSILALVLALFHSYVVMGVNRAAGASVLLLIFVLFVIVYLLWYMADESSDSIATSIPIFNEVV